MYADKYYLYAMWLLLLLLGISGIQADIHGCDYFDTVRLTENQRLPNGSYQYEKIIIPPDQTGEYDYKILVDGERESVTRHLRGCACLFGTCIRLCCPKNQILNAHERKCEWDIEEPVNFDGFVDITGADGTQMKKHILDDLIVQQDLSVPCAGDFYFSSFNNHNWKLFEVGLTEYQLSQLNSRIIYFLYGNDTFVSDLLIHFKIPSVFMLSILCLILTIIVYTALPKLRNLHGYCFVCYLFSLLVVFVLLLCDKWFVMSEMACKVNGYVGYFAVMSLFHWLTVMSFDLWRSFRGTNYNDENTIKRRFAIYSICVWSIAALLTIAISIIDSTLDPDNENELPWIPGVALYNCWVKTDDWSAMLYYYGPMSVQILFNLIMFVLTNGINVSIQTKKSKKEIVTQSLIEFYNSDILFCSYGLFVRLIVIMGVPWTFEIFSYLSQSHETLKNIFILFDYINGGQGILIFVMFVLKRSVLKQIANR
ncbi:hypothetical protein KR044_011763 [Drosophila immigrans]|nr:hypothetical protein KR044_011763 [Drosophila immigrans]